jgi:hypothetical protein
MESDSKKFPQRGDVSLGVILGLVLISLALPASFRLVQQNQEVRRSAASCQEGPMFTRWVLGDEECPEFATKVCHYCCSNSNQEAKQYGCQTCDCPSMSYNAGTTGCRCVYFKKDGRPITDAEEVKQTVSLPSEISRSELLGFALDYSHPDVNPGDYSCEYTDSVECNNDSHCYWDNNTCSSAPSSGDWNRFFFEENISLPFNVSYDFGTPEVSKCKNCDCCLEDGGYSSCTEACQGEGRGNYGYCISPSSNSFSDCCRCVDRQPTQQPTEKLTCQEICGSNNAHCGSPQPSTCNNLKCDNNENDNQYCVSRRVEASYPAGETSDCNQTCTCYSCNEVFCGPESVCDYYNCSCEYLSDYRRQNPKYGDERVGYADDPSICEESKWLINGCGECDCPEDDMCQKKLFYYPKLDSRRFYHEEGGALKYNDCKPPEYKCVTNYPMCEGDVVPDLPENDPSPLDKEMVSKEDLYEQIKGKKIDVGKTIAQPEVWPVNKSIGSEKDLQFNCPSSNYIVVIGDIYDGPYRDPLCKHDDSNPKCWLTNPPWLKQISFHNSRSDSFFADEIPQKCAQALIDSLIFTEGESSDYNWAVITGIEYASNVRYHPIAPRLNGLDLPGYVWACSYGGIDWRPLTSRKVVGKTIGEKVLLRFTVVPTSNAIGLGPADGCDKLDITDALSVRITRYRGSPGLEVPYYSVLCRNESTHLYNWYELDRNRSLPNSFDLYAYPPGFDAKGGIIRTSTFVFGQPPQVKPDEVEFHYTANCHYPGAPKPVLNNDYTPGPNESYYDILSKYGWRQNRPDGGTDPQPTVFDNSSSNDSFDESNCSRFSQGDADCNGVINVLDFSIWRKEKYDQGADETKGDWQADFTGDGYVKNDDFSIWLNNLD